MITLLLVLIVKLEQNAPSGFLKKKKSSAPCVTSINHATGTQIVKWLKKKAV